MNPKFQVGITNDEELRSKLPNIQKDFWINLAVEKEFGLQPGDKIFDNEMQIFFVVDDDIIVDTMGLANAFFTCSVTASTASKVDS